jgi:lycopene beta-cyclase
MADDRILIAGAGLAGLALADRLLAARYAGEIVLVDRRFDSFQERTWCFWGDLPPGVEPYMAHTWERLRVATPGDVVVGMLRDQPYHRVEGARWGAAVTERLRSDSRVRFERADVFNTEDCGDHVRMQTSGGVLRGRWAFEGLGHPFRNGGLVQHFGGWEVETDEPRFDPAVATLMEFGPASEGAAFHYVLPTSGNRALVEYAVFSKAMWDRAGYDAQVRSYLERRIPGNWRVVRTEYGAIPLRPESIPQQRSHRVFRIGAAGGMTKPSTGYTFRRTLDQVEHVATTLVREGAPRPLPDRPRRHRYYDRVFLRLMEQRPDLASDTFFRLFSENDFDRVFRFLSEETSMEEEVWLLSALPFLPFLQVARPGRASALRSAPSAP